jgi:hypothetical protein
MTDYYDKLNIPFSSSRNDFSERNGEKQNNELNNLNALHSKSIVIKSEPG